jgi:hypothetical protein
MGGAAGESNAAGAAGENNAAGAAGALDCTPSLATCNGKCVDTDKDAQHCGACGHDCLGGECTLGVCQPIEIANAQGREFIIAVDADFIYWGGDGAVVGKKRIDNSGVITQLVPASGKEYAYFGALTATTLYWANDWKDNGVRGCALPSCAGGPSLLISGTTPPGALTYSASASTLYFPQGASIWHQPLPSGTAAKFVTTTNSPRSLQTDDSFLYWAEYDAAAKTAEIRKAPLAGGSTSSLASSVKDFDDLAVYAKKMYVLTVPTGASAGPSNIVTVALPNGIGTASPTQFAPAGAESLKLTADASGVYWTQRDGTNGSIRHCPLAGCTGDPEILAPSTTPWGITTDANAIYWTTEDGFVMKLAK